MRKSFGILLVTGIAAVSLSGCWYQFHRVAGPCYGTGCPAFTSSAQGKVAAAPSAPAANARAQSAAAPAAPGAAADSQAAPAQAEASQGDANQAKPGVFTRMLTALHLHSKS
ncbi:MAG: hypothetical protein WB780_16640 [Candidatus Acidiferrales bacterium]